MLIICNKILWAIATSLIILIGIHLTYRFSFVQFRYRNIWNSLFSFKKTDKGISPLSSLMMVLAGRIGVGSIAGVALAIYLGGPGSIFWMWVISLLAASSTFAETILGMKYHERDGKNLYRGGPSYYIKYGLNYPWLGGVFAFLVFVSYIGGFIGIQANTIVKATSNIFSLKPELIGFLLCFLIALIIFGGIEKISKVTNRLVPIMTIFYLGIAGYICIQNITLLPTILATILKDAFHLRPFFTSFLSTCIIGIQRGIFSNEAGLGTGSIASSTTSDTDIVKNGYIQVAGVYITTFLICTATAFIILMSQYETIQFQDLNGIEITQYAFTYHLGHLGNFVIFASIILFSFSTILTGYYYGESCLKYFFHDITKKMLLVLKILTMLVLFLGAVLSAQFLWNLVDVFVALLAIINMIVLYYLSDDVANELQK